MSNRNHNDVELAADAPATTPSYRPTPLEKQAPCQAGCANCGDIRAWIGTVAQRKKAGISREVAYARAWCRIDEINPFPATLGRICPHPCESRCNRGELDEPLAISQLERFLGDHAITAGLPLPRIEQRGGLPSIGVIGAGPSGLSFAYQMARRGYPVAVYDARKKAGGMLRYGVPDYRLPQSILDAEVGKIVDLGVELHLDMRVGRDVELAELRGRHDHLYLAIGAQAGQNLEIPGANGPSVWNAIDYLERMNRGQALDLGSRVVVIGGGNSAMDAARCARRQGSEVTVLYRRRLHEMPAIKWEVEEAVEEGVQLMLLVAPVKFEREADGRLVGLEIRHMQPGSPDSTGRSKPEPVIGSEFCLPVDAVIAAIAQRPVLDGLDGLDGLQSAGGWLVRDDHGTAGIGMLAGGDVCGPGIAGDAIIQGRHTAEHLHARLNGQAERADPSPAATPITAQSVRLATRKSGQAVHAHKLSGQERVARGMADTSATISEEEFLHEVERCFSCGACLGCGQCNMYCTSDCFIAVDDPRPGHYFTLNLDECRECGKCIEVCPSGYLEEM